MALILYEYNGYNQCGHPEGFRVNVYLDAKPIPKAKLARIREPTFRLHLHEKMIDVPYPDVKLSPDQNRVLREFADSARILNRDSEINQAMPHTGMHFLTFDYPGIRLTYNWFDGCFPPEWEELKPVIEILSSIAATEGLPRPGS